DFPRRATIDLLRNTYLDCPDLSDFQIDMLDRISREQVVVHGREHWLDAVDRAGRAWRDDENEYRPPGLTTEEIAALRSGLDSFFARITPPEQATARDYIRWFEVLIGPDAADNSAEDESEDSIEHFRMIDRVRRGTSS